MDDAQLNAALDEILGNLDLPLHEYLSAFYSLGGDGVTYRILIATRDEPTRYIRVGNVAGRHNAQAIADELNGIITATRRLKGEARGQDE